MTALVPAIALILLTGIQQPAANPAADAALLEAAQQNDTAAVRRALEQGAHVNARTRHDATALLLGAMNGNMEIVRLLVERGADLTVQDTFYKFTPISAAIVGTHLDIVRYLIEKGSPGATAGLNVGVRLKNAPLLEVVLAHPDIPDQQVAAAHAFAKRSGDAALIAVARKAMAARGIAPDPIISMPAADLAAYAGTYRSASGRNLVIALTDNQLSARLTVSGMLFPVSDSHFFIPERAAEVTFAKRGAVVERATVRVAGGDGTDYTHLPAGTPTPTHPTAPDAAPAPPAAGAPASAADVAVVPREPARPWPSFRGSAGSGVGDGQGAVVDWDTTTGRNIRWKTAIPGLANSSPIVWGNRVFVTTAVNAAGDATFRTGLYGDTAPVNDMSQHRWKLFALDAKTGAIAWEREIHQGIPRTKRHPKGSQASSTPATDGRHIVVLIGTAGVLATYDMTGALLWKNDLGLIDSGWFYDNSHQWGHSSSPVIYKESVIVQVDRQKDSFVAAYALATGKELWRTSRSDEIPTWGTPAIATGKLGDELITNGSKVRGYDPATGALRWTLAPNSEITIATPVVGPDLVYVTGGYQPAQPIYAIRPGFTGDISLTEGASSNQAIAWSHPRDGTYIPTPLLYRGLLYTFSDNGIITAYDAQSGKRAYRARVGVGGAFSASPVAADGRLYFASEDGEVFVARAGPEYVQLSKQEMKEVIMATPAIADGLIVIRTAGHVYAIGSK